MAERRMLSRSIIESDAFLDLPADAKVLYFYLNCNADDRGFVDKPRAIMRMCGASDDSMRLLLGKKFVLIIGGEEKSVVLIKHWRIHNYIQKDRFKESKYRELLEEIYLDENGAYSTTAEGHIPCLQSSVSKMYTDCIHFASKMDTQVRLGKSKDRDRVRDRDRKEIEDTTLIGSTVDGGAGEEYDPEDPYRATFRAIERMQAKAAKKGEQHDTV